MNQLNSWKPVSSTIVAQIKVPGIHGILQIFWNAADGQRTSNNLECRGYWYLYQAQLPPQYIGLKKSDVIDFIEQWMSDPGVLCHVPNVDRFRGRFICEHFEMEGITDCMVSIGVLPDSDSFSYEVVSSAKYFHKTKE